MKAHALLIGAAILLIGGATAATPQQFDSLGSSIGHGNTRDKAADPAAAQPTTTGVGPSRDHTVKAGPLRDDTPKAMTAPAEKRPPPRNEPGETPEWVAQY
jgi:hypothetical protein